MASNIEQNLKKIQTARYGKDVRQAIHDSIHDCYEDGKAGAVDLVARERIDNLVVNEGSIDKDSELVDIRVGADGIRYPSAGEAVRGQIGSLSEEISELVTFSENLYNKETTVDDFMQETDGSLTVNANYTTSDYIDIFDKKGMYITGNSNGKLVYYDENKQFVSQIDNIMYYNQRTIPKTKSIKYLRVSFAKTEKDTFMLVATKNPLLSDPVYEEYGISINDNIKIPKDNTKLDKNQGSENSGKYLKINEDGNAIPESVPIDERLYIGSKLSNPGTKDGDETISIGTGACRDEKCGMIAIGVNAGAKTTSEEGTDNGHYSVAIGHRCLGANTTGDHNTAIGWGCMGENISGDGNTAIGEDALCHSRVGNNNTCIGNRAMQKGDGNSNVAIGVLTMYSSLEGKEPTGNNNVVVGSNAGQKNGPGSNNVCIGLGAGNEGENIDYSICIGALSQVSKSRQIVIGSIKGGTPTPTEAIISGDPIFRLSNGVFAKLSFEENGTITWKDVSAEIKSEFGI